MSKYLSKRHLRNGMLSVEYHSEYTQKKAEFPNTVYLAVSDKTEFDYTDSAIRLEQACGIATMNVHPSADGGSFIACISRW